MTLCRVSVGRLSWRSHNFELLLSKQALFSTTIWVLLYCSLKHLSVSQSYLAGHFIILLELWSFQWWWMDGWMSMGVKWKWKCKTCRRGKRGLALCQLANPPSSNWTRNIQTLHSILKLEVWGTNTVLVQNLIKSELTCTQLTSFKGPR